MNMNEYDALLAALPRRGGGFDWQAIEALPLLRGEIDMMRRTPQDPLWHAEGDVWTHTRMVCDALTQLDGFHALGDSARDALALAALLHDVGKSRCTREEGGHIVAPHHGPKGACIARALLWAEYGLCGEERLQRLREAVCHLIKYHTAPTHLLDGDSPELRLHRLAADSALMPGFTMEALCLLSEADVRGRTAPDRESLLEKIELCRMLAREQQCFSGAYPFATAYTRHRYLSGAGMTPDTELYDATWGEVTMLCGLPGTGKDTWIAANRPGVPVVSLDAIRAELRLRSGDDEGRVKQLARERAREHMRAKREFVWNATSLTEMVRTRQTRLFETYGARVRIVFLETPWFENLRRNAQRSASVPEGVIAQMLRAIEPPEIPEACAVEWRCV